MNADEAKGVEDVEDGPGDELYDVEGEDHVVDDGREEPGDDAEGAEEDHDPEPHGEGVFLLLA